MKKKPAGNMLSRGLRLLIVLGDYPDGTGVSRLARDVGLPVSTAHRLLRDMEPLGFVDFDPERRQYSLGLRLFELSTRVSSARRLSAVALPSMERVTQATGEATLLGILAGEEFMYVERVEGQYLAQIRGSLGERGPLHALALGKALLAFQPEGEREALISRLHLPRLGPNTITDANELREELARVRARGYATNDEELEAGICAIAVPVMGARGRVAASIGTATLKFRRSVEELKEFVPLLQDAANDISVQIGGEQADDQPAEDGRFSG